MNLMSDRPFDGRPFRILTVVGRHAREELSIAPRGSFRAHRMVEVLDRLVGEHGRPRSIRVDSGPEFASRMLDRWAFLNGVEIDSSRPGTPTDNTHVEAFNARPRAECLSSSLAIQAG
jgi:putative transposase